MSGFNEVRNSEAVKTDLRERAQRMAAAAGGEPDFEVQDHSGATRARFTVEAVTEKGRAMAAEDRALDIAFASEIT